VPSSLWRSQPKLFTGVNESHWSEGNGDAADIKGSIANHFRQAASHEHARNQTTELCLPVVAGWNIFCLPFTNSQTPGIEPNRRAPGIAAILCAFPGATDYAYRSSEKALRLFIYLQAVPESNTFISCIYIFTVLLFFEFQAALD